MAKQKPKPVVDENIIVSDVDNVLKDRFMRYAKYVIQERAIPDIRDGLKPVQRRILYAMHVDRNIFSHPHRKSAKTVGNVIANFHPHGDSSVYDAMVRLSQPWKVNHTLVDMQGNNGSLDDDPAAAMRYTEARLSAISDLLLLDIDKESVDMELNFDDTTYEPSVLPSRIPNLLLNGATGIAIGYATDIPPHNLQELIEAITYRIARPKCSLDELLDIIKGPDFPTGGIVSGNLRQAYETGNGKCLIRAKTEVVQSKQGQQIIITEIPYEVVKSTLVSKITDALATVDTALEVRDETGREEGLRIVIDLKEDANVDAVLHHLYKQTALQTNYSFNMVAINNKKPLLFSLIDALDAFIAHQFDLRTRICRFDLAKAERRLHIIEGLIIANRHLDEVIAIIRSSIDKAGAKTNLEARFNFTPIQSEAIVTLQLYRLSRTDLTDLVKEAEELTKNISYLQSLLADQKKMMRLISKELVTYNQPYFRPRRTQIVEELSSATVAAVDLIAKEDVYVSLTRDGYLKRSSVKSFAQSSGLPATKVGDIFTNIVSARTDQQLLIFFASGQYILLPVYQAFDNKWRDEGKHLSTLAPIGGQDKVVNAILVADNQEVNIVQVSKNGFIKRSQLSQFEKKSNRTSRCFALSSDDALVHVGFTDGDAHIVIATENGYIIKYSEHEVPVTGIKSGGVKAISDPRRFGSIVSVYIDNHDAAKKMVLYSCQGGVKVINYADIATVRRLNVPVPVYRTFKSNPQTLAGMSPLGEEYAVLTSAQRLLDVSTIDTAPAPFDRILKPSLELESGELITFVSHYATPVISNETKTYAAPEPIKKEVKTVAPEEHKYESMTIFDFLDD